MQHKILIPILKRIRNDTIKIFVAYCPEKANPGDKKNDLKIVKVI